MTPAFFVAFPAFGGWMMILAVLALRKPAGEGRKAPSSPRPTCSAPVGSGLWPPRSGRTVAVVGDGAIGLLAVMAARHLGAERIIAMSRHEPRQKLAFEFGATDIVEERGDEGVSRIKELTNGLGTHSVIEAVGQESMMQAIRSTRPGGHVGYVGVLHDVELPGDGLSSPTSTCTAVPRRFAGSCRSWSTST